MTVRNYNVWCFPHDHYWLRTPETKPHYMKVAAYTAEDAITQVGILFACPVGRQNGIVINPAIVVRVEPALSGDSTK